MPSSSTDIHSRLIYNYEKVVLNALRMRLPDEGNHKADLRILITGQIVCILWKVLLQ